MKTETYACQSCGIDVVRPVVKGQRPKWCPECRRIGARGRFTCAGCGAEVVGSGSKFCSVLCSNRAKTPRPRKQKPKRTPEQIEAGRRARRTPLRAAMEDGDRSGVIAAIRAYCVTSVDGCWLWQRKLKDGYPTVNVAGRWHQVHRLSLEASMGGALGSQHAHHICAQPACVNPEHLQPITHRENVAEMMARQSYLARIRELEAALREVAPSHPLLSMIAVA